MVDSVVIIGYYTGLVLGVLLDLFAFALSIIKKRKIWSWLIVLNFFIGTFLWHSNWTLIIPLSYLLYELYMKFK